MRLPSTLPTEEPRRLRRESRPSGPKRYGSSQKIDTLTTVKRFTGYPPYPAPIITYHRPSLEPIFENEERLLQWIDQNKLNTYIYVDKPDKEPDSQNLLYTKVITVSHKAFFNMTLLLFFFRNKIIQYLEELFRQKESITLYIYICNGSTLLARQSRAQSCRESSSRKEMINGNHSHHLIPSSLLYNGSNGAAGRHPHHRSSLKNNRNQSPITINRRTPRSGLLYISHHNNNHIIESITSKSTLAFYEQSLYYIRYKKLHLQKSCGGLVRFLRSVYRYFPIYFIRKFYLTSGSILFLNGLRLTNDIDFKITIFNLQSMIKLSNEMKMSIKPMELDYSYVTPVTEYVVTDPDKHFFLMGVKCQIVQDALENYYQHEVRNDRIKSKADVLMGSYLLNERVPIVFSKEKISVSNKKRLIQIYKFYYKIGISLEELDQMIDDHNVVARSNKQLNVIARPTNANHQKLFNINVLRKQMSNETKRAEEYLSKKISW